MSYSSSGSGGRPAGNDIPADVNPNPALAQVAFDPYGAGYGQAAAAEAHVRYKARLVDSAGNVVRRSSGTVPSKRSTGDHNEYTLVAKSAVETMYERIASELFSDSATADVLK